MPTHIFHVVSPREETTGMSYLRSSACVFIISIHQKWSVCRGVCGVTNGGYIY